MGGHRDRLIAEGLYKPLVPYDIEKRNGILLKKANGEKIADLPILCVFRRDEPTNHIFEVPGRECQSAELIADLLYSWEAWSLVNWLNNHDKQQPPRPNPFHPLMEMYAICNMDDWAAWEARHAQITLEV